MTPPPDRTRRAFALDDALGILSRTPAILDAMLRDLPAGWLTAHEGGDSWSALDVVGHLIHGEKTDWILRARIILEHGESRAFVPFDRTAQFSAFKGCSMGELLDLFAAARGASLRDLRAIGLTDADLDRRGRHPEFGAVAMRQLLATWVAHDLDHIAQIARVLARQYSDEVGPWRAYLRIINGTPI